MLGAIAGDMIGVPWESAGDPQQGKRFALNAEVRDGRFDWTCRTIDLDPKYLLGTCR